MKSLTLTSRNKFSAFGEGEKRAGKNSFSCLLLPHSRLLLFDSFGARRETIKVNETFGCVVTTQLVGAALQLWCFHRRVSDMFKALLNNSLCVVGKLCDNEKHFRAFSSISKKFFLRTLPIVSGETLELQCKGRPTHENTRSSRKYAEEFSKKRRSPTPAHTARTYTAPTIYILLIQRSVVFASCFN